MAGAVLLDMTPENAEAQLIGAGVQPGERVTVIVHRRVTTPTDAKPDPRKPSRLEKLRALKGAGARRYGPLSQDQIDADIHEFRGDE
ncbi:hypothetical protein M2352_001105 [Azospirillum fermentarium]|uniref:hypothetical protein n=1 Tax=Azospirillum fermentarium TaxID=1233114 RepID=UPI002227818D|nr:hypothetical protein [Azospirillum fermentarium]MCW2245514.1 hypothetical protein [Azospirillum fermentarium]